MAASKCIIGVASLLLFALQAQAQQTALVSPAGTKFLLYTPPGYAESASRYPLLISLHSKGEVGDDLAELTSKNPEQMPCRLIYLNRWPQHLPFIVLTPQLKPDPDDPEIQWSAAYINEVVDHVINNFRVDLQRIYVTGISRGGTGTWTYTSAYPEKVAAIVPISGRSDLTQACPIKDIPVWAFHGDGDQVAPAAYSTDMIKAIQSCEPAGMYRPRLNILHAKGHNGWNEVYNGSAGYKVFEWLLQFRKDDLSNKRPYVNAGPDLRTNEAGDPLFITGDFFDVDGGITNVSWKQTGGTPLKLDDTGSQFLKISGLITGTYQFELTVTDDKGAESSDEVTVEVTGDGVGPSIAQLILVNGETNAEVGNLSQGQVIDKAALQLTEINIRAIAGAGVASVRFAVSNDRNTRTQNAGPYYLTNQTSYQGWEVANGTYLICATPYDETDGRGHAGVSLCYKITFTDGKAAQPDTAKTPVPVVRITSPSEGENFVAPATLHIAADASASGGSIDRVEFYKGDVKIGADDAPPYEFVWTDVPAGTYTFKAKAIEHAGGSTLASVSVIVSEPPPPPADAPPVSHDPPPVATDSPPVVTDPPPPTTDPPPLTTPESDLPNADGGAVDDNLVTSIDQGRQVTVQLFPNPVSSGFSDLMIAGYDHSSSTGPLTVEIALMTGQVVHTQEISCEMDCKEMSIHLRESLPAGVYVVNLSGKGWPIARRLVVK